MKVIVNEKTVQVENSISLNSLVDTIVDDTRGMAIAINNSVVPRNLWETTKLNENDKILVIKATQGG